MSRAVAHDPSQRPSVRRVGVSPPERPLIITIDGPAGTGKSSVARDLAARLGLEFLDTGAMYRAATALAIDRGISLDNGAGIARVCAEADLRFIWQDDPPTLTAFGESIAGRLRAPDVSAAVSPVSALPEVRDVLVSIQRRIGREHPRLVSEGRDQGSVVFPDADLKIYLDADAEVRAERRLQQLRRMGQSPDPGEVLREIHDRDKRDASRAVGPLIKPADAVVFDTSDLGQEKVVDGLERLARERLERLRRDDG